MKKIFWTFSLSILTVCLVIQLSGTSVVHSQGRGAATPEVIARRNAIESELQSIATVDRKLMIPMRDGTRIATDVYRPKDTSKKYPTIFVRTPYNFNFWDVALVFHDLTSELEAASAIRLQDEERAGSFSENYDFLTATHRRTSLTDRNNHGPMKGRHNWLFVPLEWQPAVSAPRLRRYRRARRGCGSCGRCHEQGNISRRCAGLFIVWLRSTEPGSTDVARCRGFSSHVEVLDPQHNYRSIGQSYNTRQLKTSRKQRWTSGFRGSNAGRHRWVVIA